MAFLRFIGRFLKKGFTWFSYGVGTVVLGALLFMILRPLPPSVPSKTVLYLDLDQPFTEKHPTDFLSLVGFGNAPDIADIVLALKRAATDDRIVALYAKVSSPALSTAQIQEIRNAVLDFRESGKKAYVFSPSFGELEGGLGAYYLATAFDDIALQPTGEVGVAGIGIESLYFKNALAKLGIAPEFSARHEYKTGAAAFTNSAMSLTERENLTSLIGDILSTLVNDVAMARGLSVTETERLLTNGPYFSQDALALKLVDRLTYASAIEKSLTEDGVELMNFIDYATDTTPHISDDADVIAYIPLTGIITNGSSVFGTDADTSVMGANDVADTLDEALRDDTVKAVVLRLDSPGGGYIPSDAIRDRIEALKKETGKPVVCSMGSVAASGGYFISLACDKVFAQSTTLTGSVGVFGGKFTTTELFKKLGITAETVFVGQNTGFFTLSQKMTPSQKAFFERSLDRVYTDFTQKTAQRRTLTAQQINDDARGRVFTGAQAAQNGLIDAVGGIAEAQKEASSLSGNKTILPLVTYPQEQTETEMLFSLLSGDTSLSTLSSKAPVFRLLLRIRAAARLSPADTRLLYMR